MADAKKDAVAELHDNVNVVIMLATFAASALSLAGLPPGHEAVVYGSIAYTLVDGLWIAARPSMAACPSSMFDIVCSPRIVACHSSRDGAPPRVDP